MDACEVRAHINISKNQSTVGFDPSTPASRLHLISSELWSSGENGGLVIWRPVLMDRNLPWTSFFCNVDLFRVSRRWTGSVQMKSSMTFIRGNICLEKEKDNFKSREVKRYKQNRESTKGFSR